MSDVVAVAWGVGPGSGGAGSERGREPPCPELHREKSLEKAADSGRSEGGRNEGAEAARASGRRRQGTQVSAHQRPQKALVPLDSRTVAMEVGTR